MRPNRKRVRRGGAAHKVGPRIVKAEIASTYSEQTLREEFLRALVKHGVLGDTYGGMPSSLGGMGIALMNFELPAFSMGSVLFRFLPALQTLGDYRSWVLELFTAHLDKHLESVRDSIKLQRAPTRSFSSAHFEWLIRYRVVGVSIGEIARQQRPKITRQAVQKALRQLEQRLGLRK